MPLAVKAGEQLAASGTFAAFTALSTDLEAEGHPPILVVSGDRDPAYQERIWYARMVPVADVAGRRTYGGTKKWRGITWIRISSAGDVAIPGTSQHEKRRAADLGYPYNNRYTAAHARAVVLGPRHNVKWTGVNFSEDWHFENIGPLGTIGSPAGSGGNATGGAFMAITHDEQVELLRRVRNIDSQTTGADNQDPSIASHVIHIRKQVNGLPDALAVILSQVNGAPTILAQILKAASSTTPDKIDVTALAAALKTSLGAAVAEELAKRLSS